MDKYILHIDGDNFFASCEISHLPHLKGMPVVVGEERGIACAMTQEAKKLGVTRGMPIFKIKREFPQVTILCSHFDLYEHYSKKLVFILEKYCLVVERYSIDECFAEITFSSDEVKDKEKIFDKLKQIQNEINIKLGISFSIGLGKTKTLAKIGSKYNKPNGICITLEDNGILDTTPIESVWGIGRSSTQKLISLGINTAYKFASMNTMEVSSKFNKPLQEIWHELNGCIQYKVHNTLQRVIQKSYETTRSFSSYSTDKGLIFSELSRNVEIICKKLRENFLLTNNIIFSLKVVTDDGMLAYKSREVELPWHTDDPSILLNNIVPYFDKIFKNKIKCKSTGISVHNLLADKNIQRDFFQIQEKNIEKSLYTKIIDEMENKFGKNTIYLASSMQSINKRDIEDQERREKYPYEFDLPLPYMGEVS